MRIGGLFFRRRPSVIAWLVVPIFVRESVERFTERSRTYISKEIFELSPAFTDADATATVPTPTGIFWIRASLNHCRPSSVFSGLLSNPIVKMFAFSGALVKFRQCATTAARRSFAAFYRICPYNLHCPAVAQKQPKYFIPRANASGPLRSEFSESLPSDVSKGGFHGLDFSICEAA